MSLLRIFSLSLILLSFTNSASAQDDYKSAASAASEAAEYDKYVKGIEDFEKSDKFNPKLLTDNVANDMNIGDPNAPVKIVEYASLTCIHCKQFHQEVFYKLKKDYIDTGKVYFKYRHYPLNAGAVKAALIVNCLPEGEKQAFMGALFESQAQWAYVNSEADLIEKLKTVSKIAGMDEAKFTQCYGDEAKQDELLASMKQAYEQLNVTSTPSIYVNGHRFIDAGTYEALQKHIDEQLAKAPKPAGKL